MMQTTKEVKEGLQAIFEEVQSTGGQVSPTLYEQPPPSGKWSIAEHLHHLFLSAKPLVGAFKLPKLAFFVYGKSKKGSRTYDEIVSIYTQKLKEGGVASGNYVPKETPGQEELLQNWTSLTNKFISRLDQWSDKDLDKYRVPHPLIGNLTFREMMYFTHYHTNYHLQIIKKLGEIS